MIEAEFAWSDDLLTMRIEGHAAGENSALVCAAVSALAQALGAWTSECGECELYCAESGRMLLDCACSERSEAAFELVLTGLERIAEAYPQGLRVHSEGTPFAPRRCALDMF